MLEGPIIDRRSIHMCWVDCAPVLLKVCWGSYFNLLLVPNLDLTYILPYSRFNLFCGTHTDGRVYKVRQACDCPVELKIDLGHSDETCHLEKAQIEMRTSWGSHDKKN